MPERRRPFSRTWSVLLALALIAVLGDPHAALLAPRTPTAHTGTFASAEERERGAIPRRGERLRHGHRPRARRYRYGIVPHPRCHWD